MSDDSDNKHPDADAAVRYMTAEAARQSPHEADGVHVVLSTFAAHIEVCQGLVHLGFKASKARELAAMLIEGAEAAEGHEAAAALAEARLLGKKLN